MSCILGHGTQMGREKIKDNCSFNKSLKLYFKAFYSV